MEDKPNSIIRRPLPPELLCEMHKCLPLADALHILVNVPSRAIAKNNGPRMRRVVQQIKTSLGEYIRSLAAGDESKNIGEKLLKFGKEKMCILSGEIDMPDEKMMLDGFAAGPSYWGSNKFEFTVANGPRKRPFEFDVQVKYAKKEGPDKIVGIRIVKRKNAKWKSKKRIGSNGQMPIHSKCNNKRKRRRRRKRGKF